LPKTKKIAKKPAKKQAKKGDARPEPAGEDSLEKLSEGVPDMSDLQKIFEEASKEAETRPPLQWVDLECPHCGDSFDVCVDPAEGDHSVTQNCQVCCKPVTLAVEVDGEDVSVSAFQD